MTTQSVVNIRFHFIDITSDEMSEAIETLRKGGVVVFPTETAYGLAADATNPRAVERVMAIKGRETGNTLPLIAADQAMVERFCELSANMKQLTRQFWPGPLTVVVPTPGVRTPGVLAPDVVRDGTVAIRVSSHPIASALSRELGAPIVATSANVAGKPACYDVDAIKQQFSVRALQPDYYLDVGPLELSPASTIVTEKDGKIVTLRQGKIQIIED